jgi:hypothetical protein
MKPFLDFSIIIFFSIIIVTIGKDKENDINQNDKKILNISSNINENKTLNHSLKKKKNKKIGHSPINENGRIINSEVYSLNDLTFDMLLQNGNNFKWLIVLYSETCSHCQYARREIRKIFPHYRNSTKIRFGEIEINRNQMTNMRFQIEGVPYIFLLQNNSIYEMDLYPNPSNLKKFIETDFKDVVDDLKPFPPMVSPFKFGWEIIKNIFRAITNGVNEILYDKGYEFTFTPLSLIISIITFFSSICFLEYFCCMKFCPDKEEKKGKEEIEEPKSEKEEEKEKEECYFSKKNEEEKEGIKAEKFKGKEYKKVNEIKENEEEKIQREMEKEKKEKMKVEERENEKKKKKKD